MFVDGNKLEAETGIIIKELGSSIFSTKDFVDNFSSRWPEIWHEIVQIYGKGGKGAGKNYSSYSFMSRQLLRLYNRQKLNRLHYEPSPPGYGSSVIRYWTTDFSYSSKSEYPDEANVDKTYIEGAKKQVTVNKYERDSKARQACIKYHGVECTICAIDFASIYGKHGEGFIHVHHLTPMSSIGHAYVIDPIKDLRPVCPNCHAMIHRGDTMLTINEVRALRKTTRRKNSS